MTIRAAGDRYQALVEEIGNRVEESIGRDHYMQAEEPSMDGGLLITSLRNQTRVPNENYHAALEEGRQRNAIRDVTRMTRDLGNNQFEVHHSFTVLRRGSNSLVTAIAHGIPLALVGATAFFTAYVIVNNR